MNSSDSLDLDAYLDLEERQHRKILPGTQWRMVQLILKQRGPLFLGLMTVILGTFATLLEPRIFGYAIDEAIVPRRWGRLEIIVLVFIVTTGVRVFSAIRQSYYFELLGQRVTQDLRILLFSHLERMQVSVFDKNPAGRFLTRVTNDIAVLNEMFSSGFVSILCNFLLVGGILIWLLVLDLKLGLISACVFPVLIWLSVYFSRRLKIAYRDSRSKLSALNAFLAENLSGIKILHLFNRQKLHLSRFERLNQWYADAQVSSVRVFALFQPTITISAGISIALIIWFGGQETLQGTLKLGVLVAFFSYALSLFQPVREIADKWNIFLSGMTSAERIFSTLSWIAEIDAESVQRSAVPLELRGHIVFEDVWFTYDGVNEDDHEHADDLRKWVLKGFSLEIRPGQKIGIVGYTGAGKTTLISLLLRFYEPQKGRILLDGKDLKTYNKRDLRASFGIVQQDVFLFSGSFEDNVTFWKQSDRDKAHSILTSLGFKKDFKVLLHERGSNFSMGERQMIAFARAIAAEPKIWILDEATANMDSQSEMILQGALESASSNRTRIWIAHRLATVKTADWIVVLHKGMMVESGKHSDLIHQNGLYARLFRYQCSFQ